MFSQTLLRRSVFFRAPNYCCSFAARASQTKLAEAKAHLLRGSSLVPADVQEKNRMQFLVGNFFVDF